MTSAFGKFKLLERIGGGRLSQVFRVARSSGHRGANVALKRVAPALLHEETFANLVVREAALLSQLTHPHLCICYEMGVIDGCAFLTLELVHGCTLRALLRRMSELEAALSTSALLAIGRQLADVLDYLHRRAPTPLVHLDLSPQNVMIAKDGTVKLIDFGFARFLDGHDPPPLSGQIAGTVGYMSPEQATAADRLDAHADQFGLGILLWEIRHGRRLFRGNTAETWRRMRNGDIPLSDTDNQELDQVLLRMLAANPNERFLHLGEACEALRQISSADAGIRPLSALVTRLLDDPGFDRFDAVNLERTPTPVVDIPTGEMQIDSYAELEIIVDHGAGPGDQLRAVVVGDEPPDSPFLETLDEQSGQLA